MGGQGGQSGGGIMDSSIAPDSPFPNIAEATPGGQVQATPFPDITEAISNNPAQSTPGTTDSSYNQNFNNIFTANTGGLQPLPGFNNRRPMPFELQGPGTGNAPPMTQLSQYTPTTPGELSPIPEGVGPRIPRPGGPGDPRLGAQQIEGNQLQMMMRGSGPAKRMPTAPAIIDIPGKYDVNLKIFKEVPSFFIFKPAAYLWPPYCSTRSSQLFITVSYTHLTLPTTPYV